ncbi:MAG: hypothetical protein IT302_11110 [Dehalococcoidia bacterium]|nr:hypothetical protein [Dehalococcoidia bacterium]
MTSRPRIARDPVSLSMWLDAACEVAGAVVIVVLAGAIEGSTGIAREVAYLSAGVFLVAAVTVAVMAHGGRRSSAGLLAGANMVGGVVLWVAVAARWGDLEPGARWVLAAMGDSFILIGALEALALWFTREG